MAKPSFSRKFNVNNLIWFTILMLYFYYFYTIIISGRISAFINPKLQIYCYIAAAFFVILAAAEIGSIKVKTSKLVRNSISYNRKSIKNRALSVRVHGGQNGKSEKQKSEKIKLGYLLFLAPLFMGIIVNPKWLNADVVNSKGINLTEKAYANTAQGFKLQENYDVSGDIIIINNSNYVGAIKDIYSNRDKYEGKKVSITGFVYKNKSMKDNQFALARMLINCCAADAEVFGVICNDSNSNQVKENQWIRIKGEITYGDNPIDISTSSKKIDKTIVPIIKVYSIENSEETANKYIYP